MLDDSKLRKQRERRRESNRRWREANRDSIRERNREGERKRRLTPEFQKWQQKYYSRPDVQERMRERRRAWRDMNPRDKEKRREQRRAWLAIPENREKHRARRREYKRRKRAEKAEIARLLDIFNRSWPRLLEFERVTECTADRERLANIILEAATGSADEVHILARRVVDKVCGAT